jgi:hypothetical protein
MEFYPLARHKGLSSGAIAVLGLSLAIGSTRKNATSTCPCDSSTGYEPTHSRKNHDALKVFLSFCDIPITLAPRPMLRHRAEWSIRDSMRSFGARNFQLCRDLHEAVLQFCDRHMRKLRRHITDRDIDGVPNFVHIFLAINALLRSQIERAVQGLEARDGLVSTDEWAMCRELCNVYYDRFREITSCFWTEYLEPMRNEHPEVNFHELLAPDLDAIKETAADMLAFRDRIEALRKSKCILQATGAPYGYFYSIMAPEPWARYRKAAESAYLHVRELTGTSASSPS